MRIAKMIAAGVLGGGAVDPQNTGLTIIATTTGAQTLTIAGMTVATGKTVTVNWGDGLSDTYSAGAGARTHNYAGAGTWTVTMTKRGDITAISLQDTKISGTISLTNPWPSALTSLALRDLANFTYNANTCPVPSTLQVYSMNNVTKLTHDLSLSPLPATLTTFFVRDTPGFAVTALFSCNGITAITYENGLSQANVDAVLNAILENKANYTYATPVLDLLGGTNAAPSGTYQAADPVTSGKEAAYALVNGNGSYAPGPEWAVTTA